MRPRNVRSVAVLPKRRVTLASPNLSELKDRKPLHYDADLLKSSASQLGKATDLQTICEEFEVGVKCTERKSHLRRKTNSMFTGSDAVTFLVSHGFAVTRKSAVRIGRRLSYEYALFEHISLDFDLEDRSDYFYRFTPLEKRVTVQLCDEVLALREKNKFSYYMDYISDAFEEGVEVGANVYLNKTYQNTFVGRDAVSFLVNARLAKSRQDAVRIGNLLLERGIFRHCCDDHQFKDKFLFYRFVPQRLRVKEKRISLHDSIPVEELAIRFREVVKTCSDPLFPLKNSFSGSDAVDAIISGGLASSRFEAIQLGQKLESELLLFACSYEKEKPFMDNPHTYYQYNEHDTTSLQWLESAKILEKENDSVHDDELSHAGSLNVDDLFSEDFDLYEDEINESNQSEETQCSLNEYEADKKPVVRMSAFNKSMKLMEEADDDDLHESGLYSMSNSTNFNTSTTDGDALFNESQASTRYFDKFGFIIENEIDDNKQQSDSILNRRNIENGLSIREWEDLLTQCSSSLQGELSKSTLTKVKSCMRLGLPDSLRKRTWTVVTAIDLLLPEKEGEYMNLVKLGVKCRSKAVHCSSKTSQALTGIIERDLHRTFPRHILFCDTQTNETQSSSDESFRSTFHEIHEEKIRVIEQPCNSASSITDLGMVTSDIQSPKEACVRTSQWEIPNDEMMGSGGPAALRRILYAYSVYDKEVGYCQGMNFIAAMFLTFLPEEEAFWMLVAVMNDEPYKMRNLFLENMSGTHKALFIANKLVQKFLPKLARYFERENIELSMFATQWIMTVFTSTFSFELVAPVWDSFLVEGWKVVYRVILALLNLASPHLMELSMEEMFDFFRNFCSKVEGKAIILSSLNIPLKSKIIRRYSDEWERLQINSQTIQNRKHSMESIATAGSSNPAIIKTSKYIAKKMVPNFFYSKLNSL